MKSTLNKIIILVVILALIVALKPHTCGAQTWQWAKSAGGTSFDAGNGVSTDAFGNVYIAGYFSSSSIPFGTDTLTNAGNRDIFLSKYDASGNVLWAKSAGGTLEDNIYGVSTDGSGNIYITGHFSSPSITFGADTLTNAGSHDIFLAKYDSSGNVLWAKSVGGGSNEVGNGVSTDDSGNVYITGSFASSSITFGTTTLTNKGGADIFLVKYNTSGNVLWAKSAGGASNEVGNGISTDNSGNVYVTGSFASTSITFGANTLTNAGSAGRDDIFLVKYDASGNSLWAKSAGGTFFEKGISVSTDNSGNVYLIGTFTLTSITFGTTTLTNKGADDIFLVKYDASGKVLWAKSAGGSDYDEGISVSTDASGNVYITGYYTSSSITFGSTKITNTNSDGHFDIFLVKYDTSGNVHWAKNAGGTGNDYGISVSTDTSGNVFLTGDFESNSITFGTTTLTNSGKSNIFLAKLHSISTGIEPTPEIQSLVIYPNPFSVQTVLQTDYPLMNATLTVENSFGQTVRQITNISGQAVVLSRDDLVSGLYFIRLTANNKIIATKKLLIID